MGRVTSSTIFGGYPSKCCTEDGVARRPYFIVIVTQAFYTGKNYEICAIQVQLNKSRHKFEVTGISIY